MPTRLSILDALRSIPDPELGVDIVALGLVYEVRIERQTVLIRMTMTTPFCPLEDYFREKINSAVLKIRGVERVNIDMVFEPAWSAERIEPAVRLQLGLAGSSRTSKPNRLKGGDNP